MESRDERSYLKLDQRRSRGSPAPLFERLTGNTDRPISSEPFRQFDVAETRDSVRREVHRILNTRTPFRSQPAPHERLSAIHYGIPDFSHLSAASVSDRDAIGNVVSRAIESFEPRLKGVRVIFEESVTDKSAVTGFLAADMQIGMFSEPVLFPLQISLNGDETGLGIPLETE